MTFYIDTRYANCSLEICRLLKACILEQTREWSEIIFLCIGTDRVTGDCLGPYIGAQLSSHAFPMVHVYGTLSAPVHALNLTDTMQEIQKRHPGSLIIAIDSSLGQKKHLGYVTISNGALYPGAAVHKKLSPVGHIHITGIVNVSLSASLSHRHRVRHPAQKKQYPVPLFSRRSGSHSFQYPVSPQSHGRSHFPQMAGE